MIKRLDCPLLALSGLIRFEEKSFFSKNCSHCSLSVFIVYFHAVSG